MTEKISSVVTEISDKQGETFGKSAMSGKTKELKKTLNENIH